MSVRYIKEHKAVKYIYFDIKDLEKSTAIEDRKEAYKRYDNVEKEIDPDQITFYDMYFK